MKVFNKFRKPEEKNLSQDSLILRYGNIFEQSVASNIWFPLSRPVAANRRNQVSHFHAKNRNSFY